MAKIKDERRPVPQDILREAAVLTDDFAPVEYLDAIKTHNTEQP
jgi:hypothetical protein